MNDRPRLRGPVLMLGIFGTAIFYGDGVITPAISVLSAVEGLELLSPAFNPFIMPAALVIIFVLFWLQKSGTGGIGRLFGPMCALWFLTIAALGVPHIAAHPEVLGAVSPHHALRFVLQQPGHLLRAARRAGAGRHRRPRRCMPTWGTSARSRSGWPGSGW